MNRKVSLVKQRAFQALLFVGVVSLSLRGVMLNPRGVYATASVAQNVSPGNSLPSGYRDWRLVSIAHEAGNLNDLRAILGNDQAIESYRAGTLPFPDGTIIARLAWIYTPSEENNKVFGKEQSFVAGTPTNVQLMVKDSQRYAATGGWGFEQFDHGKAASAEATSGCYACHAPVKDRDYVFTRYAP
ncbi:Cytochrome P460 [Granulicella pectinivorans]|uniref:Cytochrome P460 n=1 Tax=Granulicella pectinivorans TaxID=474950 RepID=A0A1I6MQC3_9BACT|nr:cytochrome P460 family protein [Granulicella pectinivorans]SFS17900.1 Cytochrome P460 [Granulicella pectinivorans]